MGRTASLGERFESRREAQLVEYRWTQAGRQLGAEAERIGQLLSERSKALGVCRIGTTFELVEPQQHDGQRLRKLVVQLVREIAPFSLLLVEHQPEVAIRLGGRVGHTVMVPAEPRHAIRAKFATLLRETR